MKPDFNKSAIVPLGIVGIIQNLDPTQNSIALVDASEALGTSLYQYSLAASVGTLFLAASILAGGAVGDRIGRKKVMLLGVILSGIGALVSAALHRK